MVAFGDELPLNVAIQGANARPWKAELDRSAMEGGYARRRGDRSEWRAREGERDRCDLMSQRSPANAPKGQEIRGLGAS
jgi:hypothetical protein